MVAGHRHRVDRRRGPVSLLGSFLLGLLIGRWWALGVTGICGVIHAIPVSLALSPGHLSTGGVLWWGIALAVLLALTALGVLGRGAIRRFRSRCRR